MLVNLLSCRTVVSVCVGHILIDESSVVRQCYLDSLVQECKFTHPLRKCIIIIDSGNSENLRIRVECNGCSGILALSDDLNRCNRLTFGVFLLENLSFPVNFGNEKIRQCIHAGYTHTMETSGNLVAVLTEFTAGMEDCQHDLEGRPVLLRVHSGRNSSSVVLNSDGVILINGNFDMITVSGHSLVDTVVNYLIYKMMKTSDTDVSNIH